MKNISSTINSAQTPQRLLVRYSAAVTKCSTQSIAYAKCIVANSENLKKENCAKEFKEFQNCVKNVISKK
jgi:hypothetical protein